jgi:hypothetical protein
MHGASKTRAANRTKSHRGIRVALIHDPVYLFSFYAVRGGEWQGALAAFERKLGFEPSQPPSEPITPTGRFTWREGEKDCLLYFSAAAGSGVVAHECYHATNYVFQRLGFFPVPAKADELFAYYLQWLTAEVVRRLW